MDDPKFTVNVYISLTEVMLIHKIAKNLFLTFVKLKTILTAVKRKP